MSKKKKKIICPFCEGRADWVWGEYICSDCGATIKNETLTNRAYNMIFFNGHR